MKELSIEEKAKAYDEAIEKARLVLQEKGNEPDGASILSELFPELIESEDERIRKALIKLVKKAGEGYENVIDGVSIENAIFWLEKQGVQKPVELFDIPENGIENDVSVTSRMEHVPENLKSIAKFIFEYAHWNLHKDEWNHPVPEVPLFRVLDALVQEGKPYQGACSCVVQKPVEHLELKAGHWYICHRAYCCRADHLTVKEGERFMCEKDGIVKGFVVKNPEKYFIEVNSPAPFEEQQKHVEWSNYDQKELEDVLYILEERKGIRPFVGTLYLNEHIHWLKSLKNRVLEDFRKYMEGE